MMADSTWCKLVIKSQTPLGGFQCVVLTASLTAILIAVQVYHTNDRLNFSCDPKPSDFIRNSCYNKYIDSISKPHGLIPRNVVAITFCILCACWIAFAFFGPVTLRKIQRSTGNVKIRNIKTFSCFYYIHVLFRIFFLGGMLGLSSSYHAICLPSIYMCEVDQTPQNNNQTMPSSLNQTKMTLQCNDLHYREKSNLNIAVIAVGAIFILFGISEILYLWCTKGHVVQKILGDVEIVELGPLLRSLPEKPTITNVESEVDKDFTVTWSKVEANSRNCSIKYRLEWTKQPMTQSTVPLKWENIVETHYEITGLEYDAEYEVKLFAVNKPEEYSEPDVRTFKTKSAIGAYTTALKTSILQQTEFQPKLLASHTISSAKTDEIFTNLLIQHGRKRLTRNDETYSRREDLEYFGKVSGTPVKHCDEIFLGTSSDQENPNSILVVGKAGIGKSLFCQKLIRDWANNNLFQARENIKIPNFKFAYLLTFRQLNLLDEEPVTLREILNYSSILEDNSTIDDVTFEYIVEHPREVLIILDGYDEYSQQDYIAEDSGKKYQNNARCKMPVAALCSKLIKGKTLKGSVVVVTSRPDESNKLGGICFKRYVEIVGFSSEQVKEYIEKYFKEKEKMKSAVLEHVMKNENLVSFAHVPMLCYLLCFEMEYTLTESGNPDDLSVSTTDIYTKLIDIFELKHCAESEYRQKEIPEPFNHPPVIKTTEKLSKLAAKLLLESKPTFDEKEIDGGFDVEEVRKMKGSGLLHCGQSFRTSSTTTTKHFCFTHLTVQEFLAAHWFVKEKSIPDDKCSAMVFQFMAGILSNERNEKLMEELMDSPRMDRNLKMKCLTEYQDKEFAKKFIRNHPPLFIRSMGTIHLASLSDVDCTAVSFVLNIIGELIREEAGETQHQGSDKLVAVTRLALTLSELTQSGIQSVCNSLNNEHSFVSELELSLGDLTDKCIEFILRVVVSKLTTLSLSNNITDTSAASLCEALQHPSGKLNTLDLADNEVTDTGVASLCEALQRPSCKLTTLNLRRNEITDTGVASLCRVLQHPSCKLTTLNLCHNEITDIGVASLCKALQHPSCKLTMLYLLGNEITDAGVPSLCEAFQHPSCKLTTLELPGSINHKCRESLQAIIERCRPSLHLSFRW